MKLKVWDKYNESVSMPYKTWRELRRAVITAKINGYAYRKEPK